MSARFWHRVTWALSALCILTAITWIGWLGSDTSLDGMRARGPYGVTISWLAFLAWFAGERWREALRRS